MSNPSYHGIFSSLQQAGTTTGTAWNNSGGEELAEEKVLKPASTKKPSAGQLAVDIFEQNGYFIIQAPIAGIRLKDIDIEIDGKILTISGCRHRAENIKEDQYFLQECYFGPFTRSITLPMEVDPKQVKATFSKECVLKIIIPRKEEKIRIVQVND